MSARHDGGYERISSARNPRYQAWQALRTRTDRLLRGAFLLDGEKLSREAVSSGKALTLIVDERRSDRFLPLVEESVRRGAAVAYVAGPLLARLADTPSPQGVMVEALLPEAAAGDALGSRVIALDGVQDPGNVGTIVRTADAAGCSGVLLNENCADPYSMKAVRASMGSVFRVPICVTGDLAGAVAARREKGMRVVAADSRGNSYARVRIQEPWALIVGSEGRGVSGELAALADELVSIPMREPVESLNAAVAAAVLVYALTGV